MESIEQDSFLSQRFARMTDVQKFVAEDDSPELCFIVLERALRHAEEFYGSRSSVFGALLIAAYDYHASVGSSLAAMYIGRKLRKFVLDQYRYSSVRRTLSRPKAVAC